MFPTTSFFFWDTFNTFFQDNFLGTICDTRFWTTHKVFCDQPQVAITLNHTLRTKITHKSKQTTTITILQTVDIKKQ